MWDCFVFGIRNFVEKLHKANVRMPKKKQIQVKMKIILYIVLGYYPLQIFFEDIKKMCIPFISHFQRCVI